MTSSYYHYSGEEFWDSYLRGFRPSDYFYVESESHVDESKIGQNEDLATKPKLRRNTTDKLKSLDKQYSGRKERTINETDYEYEEGIFNTLFLISRELIS